MKVFYQGKELLLGERAKAVPLGNPPCCQQARVILRGAKFCVCAYRSYCPAHGIRHVGTHD